MDLALRWLRRDMPSATDVSMLCEVQMLLRDYADTRTAMHEPYRITRAASGKQLFDDFAQCVRACVRECVRACVRACAVALCADVCFMWLG